MSEENNNVDFSEIAHSILKDLPKSDMTIRIDEDAVVLLQKVLKAVTNNSLQHVSRKKNSTDITADDFRICESDYFVKLLTLSQNVSGPEVDLKFQEKEEKLRMELEEYYRNIRLELDQDFLLALNKKIREEQKQKQQQK